MKSLDEIFDLFRKERRRFALYYLESADGPVPIDELVEQIYRWENDSPDATVPDDRYEEVVISLTHNHIPKIDEASHVVFDSENQQLRLLDLTREAGVLLSVSKAIENPSEGDDIDHLQLR